MDGTSYEYLPKGLVYVCCQLAIGVATVRWLLRDSALGEPSDGASAERWFFRCAVANGVVLLAFLLLRVWAHTAAAFGADQAWSVGNLRLVALESRWGLRWQWQVYAALPLLCGAVAIRRHAFGWPLYTIGALSLTAVMPLLGHAGGSAGRYVLHAVHLLASAIWVGSLGVMALMTLSGRSTGSHADLVFRAVQRFSPIALTSAALVVASGSVAAFLYVGSWNHLWSTTYGRILTSKAALVGVVLLCGWRNWQRARSNRPPLRAVVVLEYLVALGVVAVTAVLTEIEHP